jgi:hypothetical protein
MNPQPMRQGITPRQVITILVVATVAMLLVPIGAHAAKNMLVSIVDSQTGEEARVQNNGALSVGDEEGPLTVDGAVAVQNGNEPLAVDGSVFPGLPENRLQFDILEDSFSYEAPAPYVALTSITVTNSGDEVLQFHMNGSYRSKTDERDCGEGSGPVFKMEVQPHTTMHVDLPVPFVFSADKLLCGEEMVPTTHNGFIVSRSGSGSVLIIGYHG